MLIKTRTTKEYAKMDVYNPSVPFVFNGKTYILGRIESRYSEKDTLSAFFEETSSGYWRLISSAPTLKLQDPFITKIKEHYVIGGVEVVWNEDGITNTYSTVFYYGTSPFEIQPLMQGPDRMKGIRLVAIEDDTIGIFTRPQGSNFGLGKIGFTTTNGLDVLSASLIVKAPLLQDQFGDKMWGGVNHAISLGNGKIGVVGHRAWFTEVGRKYEAICFEMDIATRECTQMKTLAQRCNFPKHEAKRPDLEDVIYPSGVYVHKKKTVLIAGLSDVAVGKLEIEWPFSCVPAYGFI